MKEKAFSKDNIKASKGKKRMSTITEAQELEVSKILEQGSPSVSVSSSDQEKEAFEAENLENGRIIVGLSQNQLKDYIRVLRPHLDKIWTKKDRNSWRLQRYQSSFKARREMKTTSVLKHPFRCSIRNVITLDSVFRVAI